MRVINLTENTPGAEGCGYEHGLCFYIETEHHRLLMDTGQTDLFARNAEQLGIDLTLVDTVVISHGHYDHGGGLLHFARINPGAKIYIRASAFRPYYSIDSSGKPHYIGLAEGIRDLPGLVVIEDNSESGPEGNPKDNPEGNPEGSSGGSEEEKEPGIYRIDEELSLFSGIGMEHPIPSANERLKVETEAGLVQDDFRHEQCLVIREGGRSVLLSGCAHHGILNILDRYRTLYGSDPDVVFSGFHMMKRHGYSGSDLQMIIDTALALKRTDTIFFTGHCTGQEPYEAMKKLMGDRLRYIHSGDKVQVMKESEKKAAERAAARKTEKKRSSYMKSHKFFAWATVACFLMTMWTGYKKK